MTSRYATKLELVKNRFAEAIILINEAFEEMDDLTLKNSKLIMPHEKILLEALQCNIGSALDAARGVQNMACDFGYYGRDIEEHISNAREVA